MPHGTYALAAVTSTKAAGFILRKKPLHINTIGTMATRTDILRGSFLLFSKRKWFDTNIR